VQIQSENQTLASVTFQNYFRMYGKLGRHDRHRRHRGLRVPGDLRPGDRGDPAQQGRPIRKDEQRPDLQDHAEKYDAVIKDIRDCHERGQPVLVGTTSIENSELISGLLTEAKLPHQVLNAKQHAKEAEIVAQAGRPGVITIATNMAGRGTDIVLGGNVEKQIQIPRGRRGLAEDEKERRIAAAQGRVAGPARAGQGAGGLRIVATERHESRRIDNQLRGRSAARATRARAAST
jgi:preprotein translocase subunit SecA